MTSSTPLMMNWTPMQTSKKPIRREIASMPPLPTRRMIAPELRREIHKITLTTRNVSTGATFSTQAGKSTPLRTVEAEEMIIAIVPGPAVLGIASGTKAMFTGSCAVSSSSCLCLASTEWPTGFAGNSIRKPINATISPPAMRSPGMEMPNVCSTALPAYQATIMMANT
ncbi:hypothetical protein PAJ_3662 [Pantoea ananatis AJ13355]|uniref:Uncharacterized protein n=1 Tax=Pantoea ananatis (strain AJ13355) TaxID=932677 RepID=A0A0H3L323_PANAA|nr:hypothetical protein PAJ_3662 [Pantoea ananatis AJ13355]